MRGYFIMSVVISLLASMPTYADPSAVLIKGAWINEAPPTININAAYLLIENNTDKTIFITKVESPDYERIEIHRSILVNGLAKMELQTQLGIEAKSQLQFTPGGYHLMLFNPGKLMHAGEMTSLIVSLSDEITISVEATVKKIDLDNSSHH
jgi:copper(I)-binding protein